MTITRSGRYDQKQVLRKRRNARLASRTRLTPAGLLALDEAALAEAVRPSGYFRAKARKAPVSATA